MTELDVNERHILQAAIAYVEAEVAWRRNGGPARLRARQEGFATLRSYVEHLNAATDDSAERWATRPAEDAGWTCPICKSRVPAGEASAHLRAADRHIQEGKQ